MNKRVKLEKKRLEGYSMNNEVIDTATSYSLYKDQVAEYLKERFCENATILDVGAGSGTYWNLLGNFYKNMDAVEVFKPNIENYELEKKYREVYNINIKNFKYSNYNIIIFGDVIEHLTVKEAQKVLKYACNHCQEMIVAVPYMCEQGEYGGNVYEIHKQDDLTKENMLERYTMLKLLYADELYGYYVKDVDYGK